MGVPAFLIGGIVLAFFGAWLERRRRAHGGGPASLKIDLNNPHDRRVLVTFISGSVVFLLLSAIGSYNAFNFTESVTFCGETCHKVMKPELTTHDHGPHARVACVECHVGKGVSWFVKSKISGSYQLYAVAFNKYPRPIRHADQKPAPGARDLRGMPLAAVVRRQPGPHVQLFPKRRVQLALFHPPAAENRRQRSARRAGRRHSLAQPARQQGRIRRHRRRAPENSLGARDRCAGQSHRVQDQKFHQRHFQDGNPHDGLHGLPQPAVAPLSVAGEGRQPGRWRWARLTRPFRGSRPTPCMS